MTMAESSTYSSTNPFRPAPIITPDEEQKVKQIVEVTCTTMEDALKHLRRKNGNLEQAIDSIFSGETVESDIGNTGHIDLEALRSSVASVVAPAPKSGKSSPPAITIDLTGDEDEEMNRAVAMSLQDQGTTFQPSDRAPNPDWAMVPSNVAVTKDVISQDDQQMSQAIEASLHFEVSNDGYNEVSLEERVRKGDCPVALRPTLPSLAYAGLLLHALYFVPQVRDSVARWRPLPTEFEEGDLPATLMPPTEGSEWMTWSLLELFVNMDLARMSELNVDKCMNAFDAAPWNMGIDRPGDISNDFYSKLAFNLEIVSQVPQATDPGGTQWPRLFFFRYNYSDADPTPTPYDGRLDLSVVKVDIRGTPKTNDLLSCLSSELFPEQVQRQQVIFQPSEVVAFQLMHNHSLNSDRETFSFPPHLYLDQFLRENVELAHAKRKMQWDLNAEIERLSQRKAELTHHADRDVLADLRSSIHYYENVAECPEPDRKTQVEDTLLRLYQISQKIETELREIEETIVQHRARSASAFDCPELQQHRYDLRVVLVHDGFHGRSHLYSYVKYKGVWWKTVDYVVTEVSEEVVLNDAAGLHLGAGPYFLIYSAALTEEEENAPMPWPEYLKDTVKHNNITYLAALPEEIRATVIDPNSPPVTPFIPPSLDDEELPDLDGVPLASRAEQRMEID